MEGGSHGGGYPNYGNSRKHPLAPPPLTAIGRFLQGQSSQNHFSHHNFVKNKETFIPLNGVYGFSSSSSEEISGLYNQYEVPSASCAPMEKIFAADHGVFSENYRNMPHNNEVTKSGTNMKLKVGGGRNNLIKGQWTDEEDKKLLRLVKQHGVRKWAHIAEEMIGRAGKQCRERWHNHLRPDIKKDTWSEDEERMLVEAHRKVGNKWAEIAKLIHGRTENSIKNHWNATKRRQNSCRKSKKNETKSKKLRSSILQEYVISMTTGIASDDQNIAPTTTTTTTTTNSSDDPSVNFNIIFPELQNSNADDSPSLDITQSYDDELTFIQSFFVDSNPVRQDSTNTSNDSLIHIKDPISSLEVNHLGFNVKSQYPFASCSSISNESVYIKDSKSSFDMKHPGLIGNSQYGFASSSSVSSESPFHINAKSSLDMTPIGFSANFQYGFSSISHEENSNLYMKQEDSSNRLLAPDVYMSYILEGTTTLSNSSGYGYYIHTKRDLEFDGEQSVGSGSSSNGKKEMDLVEMVFSSQLSQGSNFLI